KNQIEELDDAIRTIIADPTIGSSKSGDLQGIRVYKFKIMNAQILLAYETVDSTLYLYTFGSHQNFYRELSKYVHQ
ncbi:MAG: type II toxin-antitoxin system RelE/ParE family toxin, partial [Planctomycetes bacterium]|nr:type II toxin-antitoxin system RelE/ParE family toxin [Planctomycetota bacterium]